MVETRQGINSADAFFTLSRKPVIRADEIPPLGGKQATPEEEARMGAQLRRELLDYRAGRVEARARVLQAMSGKTTNSAED
jgi:hypothetical protein